MRDLVAAVIFCVGAPLFFVLINLWAINDRLKRTNEVLERIAIELGRIRHGD